MRCHRGPWVEAFLAILVAGLLAAPAHAQYFGRNKVQYRSFQFKRLSTRHFDIYYYEAERRMAEQAGRMAERWYDRISRTLDTELEGRQPLILYASHPDFEQTNAVSGELDESTGGVTESFKRRIVLPLAGSLAETDHVIGHELVHAFQYDLRKRGSSNPFDPGAQLPLWFIEGMAEYLSVGPEDANTSMWMRDAALSDRLPAIGRLDSPRYFPYRYGEAVWAYVASRFGEAAVGRVLKAASGKGATLDQAFTAGIGWSTDSLSREWHQAVRQWALRAPGAASGDVRAGADEKNRDAASKAWAQAARAERDSLAAGRVLVAPHGDLGRLNIAPSLSPDGRQMVFLSERDQLSIELYLADAATGKVDKRLTRSTVDAHLQSLQFVHSAGAWSPDGRRIAISTVNRGRPALAVIEVASGRTLQRIPFPALGEIFNPTWSPDGRRVAFSAIAGGATDLFVVDLGSRALERLTDDLYADLHPAWAPDGASLAFSTDRFSTQLEALRYGNMRLAIFDLASRRIREVAGADQGKNINPQWSRTGSDLYFVSDRAGASNIYRVPAGGGEVRQITEFTTGVSGITALSPALSVARDTDAMVFSAFEGGGYALRSLGTQEAFAGYAPRPPDAGASLLPAADSTTLAEATAVRDSGSLVDPTSFNTSRYKPGLTLDYASQTSLGLAAGSGGLAVGGGSAFYWSDMLGNHNLATILQLSSSEGGVGRNIGALVGYQNLARRWNWGIQGYQIPYFSRAFQSDVNYGGNEPIVTEQDIRTWQIERAIEWAYAYPLSRMQRIEFGVGYRNIDFQEEVRTLTYSGATGQVFSDVTEPGALDSIPSLSLMTASAAAVYDNSVFGGTSPVAGQRYRLEFAPVAGDLQFASVLADYRRYQKLAGPLSLAGRVIHLGRYGRDSESARISELFIGYPWLVRGYDAPSFSLDEADVYNNLFGSRLAVANFELRLPLVGGVGLVRAMGVPPIEAAAFYDAGTAWTNGEKARLLGGSRPGVSSFGTTFRVNLFGFAIAEVAYVHPNDRPLKGWFWQFNLQPGF